MGPSGSSQSSRHWRKKSLHRHICSTEQNTELWLVCSLCKGRELNSCQEEGSKNFTITSNKPISLSRPNECASHRITDVYSKFSANSLKGKPGSEWQKIISLDCGFGWAGIHEVLLHFWKIIEQDVPYCRQMLQFWTNFRSDWKVC